MKVARAFIAITFIAAIPTLAASESKSEDTKYRVNNILKEINPNISAVSINTPPLSGLLEIETNSGEVVYLTEKLNYLISGRLIDISSAPYTDLTEQLLAKRRSSALSGLEKASLITFPAHENSGEAHQVYIFTDVSCAYCVQFHRDIEIINAAGITVHYLAYPRSGINSPSAALMEQAWCAQEQQAALTEAKLEGKVSQHPLPCQSPIAEHMQFAQHFSITGTPAVFNQEGRRLGGYLDTEQLLKALQ